MTEPIKLTHAELCAQATREQLAHPQCVESAPVFAPEDEAAIRAIIAKYSDERVDVFFKGILQEQQKKRWEATKRQREEYAVQQALESAALAQQYEAEVLQLLVEKKLSTAFVATFKLIARGSVEKERGVVSSVDYSPSLTIPKTGVGFYERLKFADRKTRRLDTHYVNRDVYLFTLAGGSKLLVHVVKPEYGDAQGKKVVRRIAWNVFEPKK